MSSDDAVSILSLSDLLNLNQPLTGASSLPSTSKLKQIQISQTAPPFDSLNSPKPKTLTPLKTPSILIGTLTLPHQSLKCSSNKSCFQFSDDSGSVCCDVVDFRVRLIGKRIRVIAWNFVPLKHSGFLEIIKWIFLDLNYTVVLSPCGNLDSVALVSDVKLKGGCCVFGPIESVSPVSCVPCSISDGKLQNLRVFVVRILLCECNLCNSIEPGSVTNIMFQGNDNHRFKKPLFLYFYGSAACWHPVITKLVGSLVSLSELKKKMVFIGKEESQLMYVTTESSVLYVHFPAKKWMASERKSIKGRGECGDYTGVVKGVYMHGMVIELDKEVWLLLTDKLLVVPHSLRLGAIISVRNVHFVNPKFPWTKMLILGACCKTSITVESFSPFETKSHNLSQTESSLGKFIESLTFSARFWALILVSCFRKKFAGLFSEKEIVGSKHMEGLAQKFATSHLSPLMFRARHGVLAESCKHDSLGCGSEPYCSDLKLVLPVTTFLHYCETIWLRALPQFKKKDQKYGPLSCEKIYGVPLRRIFLGKDINVLLLGSLKISSSSGRLQLGDSTGSIDVTFADSPSNWMAGNIYELVNYCIVMEGTPNLSADLLQYLDYGSLSCRHIFHGTARERELKLGIYACAQSRNASSGKNCLICFHQSQNLDFEQSLSGRFHLILIIHKYPILQKQFQVGQMTLDGSTVFVEGVLLPWDVSLAGKDGFSDPFEDPGLLLNNSVDDDTGENDEIFMPRKRHKPGQMSSEAFALCSTDDQLDGGRELGTWTSSLETRMKCGNACFHRTSCTAKVYNASGSHLLVAGQFCCRIRADNNGADCKRSKVKVLLEFNSESFFNYQLLQIGKCYMIKHHGDSYFCGTSESDDISADKIFITSKTHIWSLSFSSDDVTGSILSSDDVSCSSSIFGHEDVLMKDVSELTLKWPTVNSPVSFKDVCLHLCADVKVLIEEKLSEIIDALIEITIVQEDTFDNPLHTLNAMSVSESSNSSCLFPEGNLATVLGKVVAIHDFDFNSADFHLRCESEDDCFHWKLFEGLTGSFCLHVLVENQMVKICSTLSNYTYPIGFGPGVTATFHRLLKLRGPGKWMLTPVSFIVINSISEVNEPCCQRFPISSGFPPSMHMPQISTMENVSSGIIYDLIRPEHNKQMQLYCRVVAVHYLVLEKNRRYNYTSKINPTSPNVNIPVACFLLDDGSSACCCWASSHQAAMLLRLHEEIPMTALRSSGFEVKWTEVRNRTAVYHLERILRKHERITVRSFGSMFYSSFQELTISVSSEDTLSCSDETLLKFIIFNACLGTSWTVVAGAMDPDAIKQLEKDYLAEMDLPLHIKDHVWAVEICHTDALAASKNLIQGLLSR